MVNIASATQRDYQIVQAYISKGKVPHGESPMVRALYNKYSGSGVPAKKLNPSWQRNTEVTPTERMNAQLKVQNELNQNLSKLQAQKEAYANQQANIQQQNIAAQQLNAKSAQATVLSSSPSFDLTNQTSGSQYLEQNFGKPLSSYEGYYAGAKNYQTEELFKSNMYYARRGQLTESAVGNLTAQFKSNPEQFLNQSGVTKTQMGTNIFGYSANSTFFESNINFNEINKQSYNFAQQKYNELPLSTKEQMVIRGFSVGATKLGVGIIEFSSIPILTFGSNQISNPKSNSLFDFKMYKFPEKSSLGIIKNYPSMPTSVSFTENPIQYSKEKYLNSPQFVGEAVPVLVGGAYSLKEVSFQGGIKGAIGRGVSKVSEFGSPFGNIERGIYVDTQVTKEFAFKTSPTNRVSYGYGEGGLKTVKIETFTDKGGIEIIKSQAPYVEIGNLGKVTIGERGTYQIATSTPKDFGSVLYSSKTKGISFTTDSTIPTIEGSRGAIIDSKVWKGIDIYSTEKESTAFVFGKKGYYSRGASAVFPTQKTNMRAYLTGTREPIYNIETGENFFSYQVKGYKLYPKTKGIEIDLTKGSALENSNVLITGGKKSSPSYFQKLYSSQKFEMPSPSQTKIQSPTVTTKLKSPSILKTSGSASILTSIYYGKGTYEKTESVSVNIQRFETRVSESSFPTITNVINPVSSTKQINKQKNTFSFVFQPHMQMPKVKETTAFVPSFAQTPTQTTRQGSSLRALFNFGLHTNTPPFNPVITFGGGLILLPPTKFPSFDFTMGVGKIGKKSPRYKYTPDFKSLIKNTRGKAPKKLTTGFESRPIPKGFTWSFNKIKMKGGLF